MFSCQVVSNSLQRHELQQVRLPCLSLSPWVCSNSCPYLVSDTIQLSHPLLPPSLALNLSHHQGLFQWVSSLHQMAKVLELQLQHQSKPRIFRVDFIYYWLVWSSCYPRNSQEFSPAPQFESINPLVLALLYGPTLTSIHNYWKKHVFYFMDVCQQSDVSGF